MGGNPQLKICPPPPVAFDLQDAEATPSPGVSPARGLLWTLSMPLKRAPVSLQPSSLSQALDAVDASV